MIVKSFTRTFVSCWSQSNNYKLAHFFIGKGTMTQRFSYEGCTCLNSIAEKHSTIESKQWTICNMKHHIHTLTYTLAVALDPKGKAESAVVVVVAAPSDVNIEEVKVGDRKFSGPEGVKRSELGRIENVVEKKKPTIIIKNFNAGCVRI